jgi:hypothetical protein
MTTVQRQCLLCYLGLYGGAVDGIPGPLTRQAEADFAKKYGDFSEEALLDAIKQPENVWDSVRYFKPEEFMCKCGGKYCGGFPAQVEPALLALADTVRAHFDAPAIVSSGLRCQTHNAHVGGVQASRHLSGKAMDFCVRGKSAQEVLAFVQQQPQVRYAYAIDANFLHMDVL